MKILKVTKNILIYFVTLLLSFIVIEIFVRFTEIQSLSNFEVTSKFGKKLRPNVNLLYLNEGFYIGKINDYGYLGPSYPPHKPENVIRIGLFGDSYVESFEVFDRHSFRKIIEEKISRENNNCVEVLNFGRSGFTLEDMYVYSSEFASIFNSDYNLFFISLGDLTDESHQNLLAHVKEDGEHLILDYSYRQSPAFNSYHNYRFLRENSAFVKMSWNCFKLIQEGMLSSIVFDKFYPNQKEEKNNKKQNRDIDISKKVRKIIEALGQNQKSVFVLYENMPNEIMKLIINNNIKVINLVHIFENMRANGIDPNYWKATNKRGHWNHHAQARIGGYLAEEMLSLINKDILERIN